MKQTIEEDIDLIEGNKLVCFLIKLFQIFGTLHRHITFLQKILFFRNTIQCIFVIVCVNMLFVTSVGFFLAFFNTAKTHHPIAYNCSLKNTWRVFDQDKNSLLTQIIDIIFEILNYFGTRFKYLGYGECFFFGYYSLSLLNGFTHHLHEDHYNTLKFSYKDKQFIETFMNYLHDSIGRIQNWHFRYDGENVSKEEVESNRAASEKLHEFCPFVRTNNWHKCLGKLVPSIYFFISTTVGSFYIYFHYMFSNMVDETYALCDVQNSTNWQQTKQTNWYDLYVYICLLLTVYVWPFILCFWITDHISTQIEHFFWLTEINYQFDICFAALKLRKQIPSIVNIAQVEHSESFVLNF